MTRIARGVRTRITRAGVPFLASLAFALAAGCGSDTADAGLPDVLLVTLDTTRADALGCYGGAASTPTLDALASAGARCTTAVAPVPLTLPSHASLLTGLYPPGHGARHNGRFRVPADVQTLAEQLAARGYRTAAVVGAAVLDRLYGLDQGFEEYLDLGGDGTRTTGASDPAERPADEVSSLALSLLRRFPEDRPLFLWVHYFDPHAPYAPPEPFASAWRDRPYLGEVSYVDTALGRLFAGWDRLRSGMARIVVVAGDHGESLGEHGEATHGLTLFEGALRVPLLFAMPGSIPAGLEIGELVELVDVVPTILDLVGTASLPASQPSHGRSLAARLRDGAAPPAQDERAAYLETLYPRFGLGWAGLEGIRTSRWKFVRGAYPALYDLDADPSESRNLLAGTREATAEERALETRLDATIRASTSEHPFAALPPGLVRTTTKRLEALGYLESAGMPAPEASATKPSLEIRLAPPMDPRDLVGVAQAAREIEDEVAAGRPEAALVRLDALPAAERERFVFLHLRGEALLALGRATEAREVYRTILARNGRDPVAALRLASLLLADGEIDEGQSLLDLAGKTAGENPAVHLVRGERLLASGRAEEALASFRRAGACPDAPQAAVLLGVGKALRALGDGVGALGALTEAAALAPASREIATERAGLELEASRPREALDLVAPWLPPRAMEPDAVELAARANLALERPKEAQLLLEELVARDPERAGAHALLGEAYRTRGLERKAVGSFETALELATRASSLAPGADPPVLVRVRALRALGRPSEAASVLREAIERRGGEAPALRAVLDAMEREHDG